MDFSISCCYIDVKSNKEIIAMGNLEWFGIGWYILFAIVLFPTIAFIMYRYLLSKDNRKLAERMIEKNLNH